MVNPRGEKFPLPIIVVSGLDELTFRGGHVGARRAQGVLFILGIKTGDDLAGLDVVADVDVPLDHPAVDAEGEVDLGLRLDGAGQRNRFARRMLLDGHDPDGTDFSGLRRLGTVAAAEKHKAQADKNGTGRYGTRIPVVCVTDAHC